MRRHSRALLQYEMKHGVGRPANIHAALQLLTGPNLYQFAVLAVESITAILLYSENY